MKYGRYTNRRIAGRHGKRRDGALLQQMLLSSRDFSAVEDSPEAIALIREIVAKAGKGAAVQAKAAGISRIFVRRNQVVRVSNDGREEIVATHPSQGRDFYVHYKAGTVFHARTK